MDAGVQPEQKFQFVQVLSWSHRDETTPFLTARDLSRTLALNKVSSTACQGARPTHSGPKTGRSFVCRKLSGRVDSVTSPCKVVRWRVLILSTSFVKNVRQCFLRSGTVAEFFDGTSVSLRGWIVTDDSRRPDAKVELSVEGVSVTVAQNIEGRGESGNTMLDLSVSALARLLDSFGKLQRRELCTTIGRTLVTCLSQVHPDQQPQTQKSQVVGPR